MLTPVTISQRTSKTIPTSVISITSRGISLKRIQKEEPVRLLFSEKFRKRKELRNGSESRKPKRRGPEGRLGRGPKYPHQKGCRNRCIVMSDGTYGVGKSGNLVFPGRLMFIRCRNRS